MNVRKRKLRCILTAHHKDDQIETFLIRLSRGSGVQGLSAMNTTFRLNNNINIFRPFLSENKKRSHLYLKKKSLEHTLKILVIVIKNF